MAMRRMFSSFAALALLGSIGLSPARGAGVEGAAQARTVHGNVLYCADGVWNPVRPGSILAPGAVIKTGPDSYADLYVNGRFLTLRLVAESTLELKELSATGSRPNVETKTFLDLKSGCVFGSIKKNFTHSLCQIDTPNGKAVIRATDFQIQALPQPDGAFRVTFTCVGGEMICSAEIQGKSVSRLLGAGENWSPGEANREGASLAGGNDQTGTPPPPSTLEEVEAARSLAANYNAFGFQLFQAVRKAHLRENVFLSPIGAGFAFSILQSGGGGGTRREITRALHIDRLPPAGIDHDNKNLLGQLSGRGGTRLEIANSLWINQSISVKSSFISAALQSYDAEVTNLDFAGGGAPAQINAWVSRRTHGAIPALVDSLPPAQVLAIIDAVYFKGQWDGPFDEKLTENKPFKLADGGRISHPRMLRSGMFQYYETRSFQLVALPYLNRATMFVLLPKKTAFLEKLTAKDWEGWLPRLASREGVVELPRFKIANQYDLIKPAQALGIRLAFGEMADFGGIASRVYVSEARQKTFVDVDEEGTTAAAATYIGVTELSLSAPPRLPPPFKMIVDHPFFVVIREESTGANLFVGAILDPR